MKAFGKGNIPFPFFLLLLQIYFSPPFSLEVRCPPVNNFYKFLFQPRLLLSQTFLRFMQHMLLFFHSPSSPSISPGHRPLFTRRLLFPLGCSTSIAKTKTPVAYVIPVALIKPHPTSRLAYYFERPYLWTLKSSCGNKLLHRVCYRKMILIFWSRPTASTAFLFADLK